MELDLIAYKLPDGLWAFDHPHDDTIEELLCNGTEKAIDTHYYFLTGNNAVEGNKIRIHLTTVEPSNIDDYDTVLTFQDTDEEGTTYVDEVLCCEVWLCPWLQGYFGEIPENIYVTVNAINIGLENFVKRTGMIGFLIK
jgi:hypothetical protein